MRRRTKIGLVMVVAAAFGLPAVVFCQDLGGQRTAIAARYPEIRWVTPETLAGWIGGSPRARPTLLDAREVDEFRVSHLRGARQVDPDLRDFRSLGLSRDARIVVYCSIGWRSGGVADRLRQAGYRRVYNLEGGIFRWANEGRALRSGDHTARLVHPYDATWGLMLDVDRRAPIP